jgi:two-component system LytT family response regulator
VHAVDYVLKPVDPDRLRDAIDRAIRVRTLERGASLAERLERLLAGQGEQPPVVVTPPVLPDRIAVSQGERRLFVDVVDVDWVEAYGNYVRVHAGGRAHLVRSTMARMEHRLGSETASALFIRIRRSALINVRAIVAVEPYGKGMFLVTLRDGSKLVSSRYHQAGLRRLLKVER